VAKLEGSQIDLEVLAKSDGFLGSGWTCSHGNTPWRSGQILHRSRFCALSLSGS
jgi:hypothetical protein